MKESEPMLETRLYRCGWIFLFILCVLEIAKKGAVSAFCPVLLDRIRVYFIR